MMWLSGLSWREGGASNPARVIHLEYNRRRPFWSLLILTSNCDARLAAALCGAGLCSAVQSRATPCAATPACDAMPTGVASLPEEPEAAAGSGRAAFSMRRKHVRYEYTRRASPGQRTNSPCQVPWTSLVAGSRAAQEKKEENPRRNSGIRRRLRANERMTRLPLGCQQPAARPFDVGG